MLVWAQPDPSELPEPRQDLATYLDLVRRVYQLRGTHVTKEVTQADRERGAAALAEARRLTAEALKKKQEAEEAVLRTKGLTSG